MTDRRHYAVRSDKPPTGTRYAFLVEALTIWDQEEIPPLWTDRLPIKPGMTLADRRYAERWNKMFDLRLEHLVDEAKELLRKVGIAEPFLKKPLSPSLQAIVDHLVKGWLAEAHVWENELKRKTESTYLVQTPAHIRVCAVTYGLMRSKGYRATATYLMHGLSRRDNGRLTRDHIYRATRKFYRTCPEVVQFCSTEVKLLQMNLSATVTLLYAFEIMYKEALRRPELAGFAGAELAREIHNRYDLLHLLDKTLSRMERSASNRAA